MKKYAFIILLLLTACSHSHTQTDCNDFLTEKLADPCCIRVVFDGRYEGYRVEAVFHPDDGMEEVGMATFTLSLGLRKISIDTPYYWKSGFELKDQPKDGTFRCEGETYHAPRNIRYVQGNEPEIDSAYPFFFKDVDFDGQKELCFTHIGYNRTYYSVYKLKEGRETVYMPNPPFNCIVDGWGVGNHLRL